MKTKVYVSGPYTKGDVGANVKAAIDATDALMTAGYAPFCPHLTHFWHIVHPHPWKEWMDYDLEWIGTCDCFLRLPGESKGADIEAAKAKELGIPVYNSVSEIIEHVGTITLEG